MYVVEEGLEVDERQVVMYGDVGCRRDKVAARKGSLHKPLLTAFFWCLTRRKQAQPGIASCRIDLRKDMPCSHTLFLLDSREYLQAVLRTCFLSRRSSIYW